MLDRDPDAEQRAHLARQWVLKAESDLYNASVVLKVGTDGPLDTVCFHVRQCVEKYVKALLTFEGIDFQRTHDNEVARWVRTEVKRRLPYSKGEPQRTERYSFVGLGSPRRGEGEVVRRDEATSPLHHARWVTAAAVHPRTRSPRRPAAAT